MEDSSGVSEHVGGQKESHIYKCCDEVGTKRLDEPAHQPAAPDCKPDEPVGQPVCRVVHRPSRHRIRQAGPWTEENY